MNSKSYRSKQLLLLSFLIGIFLDNNVVSQLVISNQGTTALTLVNGLIGSGLTVSNPVITCPPSAYGLFSGGAGIGVTNGVTLTTGTASNLSNNGASNMNTMFGTTCNDPQLTSLEPLASNDCCILEFDVAPSCNQLSIRFVFGSEEYPEYVGLGFNDAFGFFVTGPNPSGGTYINKNIAIVTGTTICSIDNVNSAANSGFYVNNAAGLGFVFDGYTVPLISTLNVVPCQTYHFKLAIADSGDDALDSGILIDFLQCSSTLSASTTVTPANCGVNNGTATVTPSNGIGILNYVWSPAPGGGQGTTTATGLTAGVTYTVTVDDIYPCIPSVTSSVTIPASVGAPNVTNSPLTQTICSGGSTSPVNLTADMAGTTFTWTATASGGISGFTASGTSTIPVQTLLNSGGVAGTVTYAITPTAGGCVGPVVNYVVTVNPQITPTFTAIPNVCQGSVAPVLPTSSTNAPAITGTWSSAVSTATAGTTTYTFTPTSGQCATTTTSTITVIPLVTPTFTAIPNVCQGSVAPVLPTSSTNFPAITGTWSPVVSTATAGTTTYTFTPSAGQCAATTTSTITVVPLVTPSFTAIPNVCQGSVAPVLPTSSTNFPAITGTWSPVVSTATAGTTTYTFTPSPGQCAATVTNTITVNAQITPTFAAISDVCLNSAAPTLPISSTNTPAIIGTWLPSVNTSSLGTTTYTFTPTAGQCATTTTNTITVVSQITPTFTPIASICQGSAAPVLPLSSTNIPALSGVWSPPTINTATTGITTYTFTPDQGQCGGTTTMDITINAPVTPTFGAMANVCQNALAPTLPLSSTNTPAVTGTWSPAVSTTAAGTTTYTFTPTAGQCATTATNTITVNPQITATFAAIPNICQNSAAPILPANSTNIPAITGTWSPSTINSASAGTSTYTFTPSAGQCALPATLSITVDPQITPTFAAIPNVCQNATEPILPTSSTNSPAITGTWSPAVSTATTGTITYTFTPTAGVCATTATNMITVNPQVTPLFTPVNPICAGSVAPTLPMSSFNTPSISGTWSPSTINNIATSTYTFTPNTGECATTNTITVTINPLPILVITDPAPVCEPTTIDLTVPEITAGSIGGTISYYINSACTVPVSSPSSVGSTGIYYIESVSSAGCTVSMPVNVSVYPTPEAAFTPVPQTLNEFNLTSTMDNQSVGASAYQWYFMDGAMSNEYEPSHTFPENVYGNQLITLIAISEEGCIDTTENVVTIVEELIYYIPNSFTPDDDDYNQIFQPVFTSGYDPNHFTMLIFDRWGEIIFETHDISLGWNGTLGGNGELVQDGVYTWKIEFKLKGIDKRIVETGHVSILR